MTVRPLPAPAAAVAGFADAARGLVRGRAVALES